MRARILVALAALLVLAGVTAGSCDDPAGNKAKRDCEVRGGTYQSTGEHSGRCLPPRGGWQ